MSALIPLEQRQSARRVLYMTHLAIGDYFYQRVFLQAFAAAHPHIQLDIWIDDCRSRAKNWHRDRNQTLVQWLQSEPYLNRVYPIAQNMAERQHMLQTAQAQDYDIVFFVAKHRSEDFAHFARVIAKDRFVAGTKWKPWSHPLKKWRAFQRVDQTLVLDSKTTQRFNHISELYQHVFTELLGQAPHFSLADPQSQIAIPENYLQQATDYIASLRAQFDNASGPVVLLNHTSTSPKRDYQWQQLIQVLAPLTQLQPIPILVLNCAPGQLAQLQQSIEETPALAGLPVVGFSATEHFYQLVALIDSCDLVVSVETATMHLASNSTTPLIALLRTSAKQWRPLAARHIIYGEGRVDNIPQQQVLDNILSEIRHISG